MKLFQTRQHPELITLLQHGGVGVLPTDTLYGLVASAYRPQAVQRLYELKNREAKPGTTIAANTQQLIDLGIDPELIDRAEQYWPNPISIVLPSPLDYVHQGRGDSPFRIVNDPELVEFLERTGPLVTSSANHPGLPPAANIQEAQDYFGDKVDFYTDLGDIGKRAPSTIIRLNEDGSIDLIREGAITIDKRGKIV